MCRPSMLSAPSVAMRPTKYHSISGKISRHGQRILCLIFSKRTFVYRISCIGINFPLGKFAKPQIRCAGLRRGVRGHRSRAAAHGAPLQMRREAESNRRCGFCRPELYHLAIAPVPHYCVGSVRYSRTCGVEGEGSIRLCRWRGATRAP